MPPKNNRGAEHPDQQPSLLDQLELDEEPGHEDDPHNYCERDRESDSEQILQREDPRHEDNNQHTVQAEAETAHPRSGEAGEHKDQSPEPLEKAYARYVEIVNDTYSSTFSDAKRRAAFKEAAKAHGVKVADLKRYSTAAALGIPYHNVDAEAEPAPLDPETD